MPVIMDTDRKHEWTRHLSYSVRELREYSRTRYASTHILQTGDLVHISDTMFIRVQRYDKGIILRHNAINPFVYVILLPDNGEIHVHRAHLTKV